MSETEKKKQKKGRVVRLSDFAFSVISENLEGSLRETIDRMVERYHDLMISLERETVRYVLPSSLFSSLKEARGAAIVQSVKTKGKQIEEPIEVKVTE